MNGTAEIGTTEIGTAHAAGHKARRGSLPARLWREAVRHFQPRDRARENPRENPHRDPARSPQVTLACVALGAKLAHVDGELHPAEIDSFARSFGIEGRDRRHLERVYRYLITRPAGYETHAARLGRRLRDRPERLEAVLDAMFDQAAADGHVDRSELRYLGHVARHFGYDAAGFADLADRHLGTRAGPHPGGPHPLSPHPVDPHHALGVSPDADAAEIKAAHRRLVRRHHPDRLRGLGADPRSLAQASARMARINAAYESLHRQSKEGEQKRRQGGAGDPA